MSCKKHKLIMFKNKHIVFVYQAVVNYFSNNVTCNNLKNLCSRSAENEIFFQHSDITFFRLVMYLTPEIYYTLDCKIVNPVCQKHHLMLIVDACSFMSGQMFSELIRSRFPTLVT